MQSIMVIGRADPGPKRQKCRPTNFNEMTLEAPTVHIVEKSKDRNQRPKTEKDIAARNDP